MGRTIDTPSNYGRWEPADTYSGMGLALADGRVIPLSNREAAMRVAKEADYAAGLADRALDRLDLSYPGPVQGDLSNAPEVPIHASDADLLEQWDRDNRR